MPAIRMTKSSMDCLKEKNGLRICQKSTLISKKSCSHVKISQLAPEFCPCMHNCQDVHINDAAEPKAGVVEPNDRQELCNKEDDKFDKHSTSLLFPAPLEGMDLLPMPCPTNFENIFSAPINEEVYSGPDFHKDEVGSIDLDPPCFAGVDESDANSGSSSDQQSCNISDFYISDMVLANFPFEDFAVGGDDGKTNLFPEYDSAESSMLFDAGERCLNLPFLDDPVDFNEMQGSQPSKGGKLEPDDSGFLQAIHQTSPDQGSDVEPYSDPENAECFDPHSFIRIPELSEASPTCRPIMLAKESQRRKPITLVLDLDETLIHSTLQSCEDADFSFKVHFNMKEQIVYVKKRPYLQMFLEKVAEMFEIVIFTASQSIYAEQLLDILDPDRKLISGRVYRDSCIFSEGLYTKDLTVLGLDLAKVVIVDNTPQVFRLQVNNGIPIKSWFSDPSDNELVSLIPFLESLVDADDVRPIIAKRFGNKE